MEIAFYCRKSKINKQGLSPIYAKITINGITKDRSTGIRCLYENWDAGYKAVKGDLICTKQILDYELELQKRYDAVKSQMNVVTFPDLDAPKEKTILDVVDEFGKYQLNKDTSEGTKRGDKVRNKYIREFIALHLKSLKHLSLDVCESFILFLNEKSNFSASTLQRHNKYLNTFLKYCLAKQYVEQDYSKIVVKLSSLKEIVHLTLDELESLRLYHFSSTSLDKVRDVFLFCCNTGLSYSDVVKFRRSDICFSLGDDPYISIVRQKTNQRCIIPLSAEAKSILVKYDYTLPIISQEKYNKYLKECCEIIGIKKRITSHVARKTCGMMLLNMGMSYDIVAKVLGHANSKVTQEYYARYMPDTIIQEFKDHIIDIE